MSSEQLSRFQDMLREWDEAGKLNHATDIRFTGQGGGKTDPNNPDTDGDGITDGEEVIAKVRSVKTAVDSPDGKKEDKKTTEIRACLENQIFCATCTKR